MLRVAITIDKAGYHYSPSDLMEVCREIVPELIEYEPRDRHETATIITVTDGWIDGDYDVIVDITGHRDETVIRNPNRGARLIKAALEDRFDRLFMVTANFSQDFGWSKESTFHGYAFGRAVIGAARFEHSETPRSIDFKQ